VKDVQKSAVRQIEVRLEAVNRGDPLIGVTAETLLNSRFRGSDDGFLRKRNNTASEAG